MKKGKDEYWQEITLIQNDEGLFWKRLAWWITNRKRYTKGYQR